MYFNERRRNNPLSIHAIEKGRKFKTRIKVDNIDYKEIFCLLQIISLSFIDEFRIALIKVEDLVE